MDSNAYYAMYVRVHPPLRRHPVTNRPLAVCSVVDNVLGVKLLQQGRVDHARDGQLFRHVFIQVSMPLANLIAVQACCVLCRRE